MQVVMVERMVYRSQVGSVAKFPFRGKIQRKRNKKVAVSVAMICSPIRGTLEGARHHGLRVAHHR